MSAKDFTTVRYSDADLAEFRARIEQKREAALEQYNYFRQEIESLTESIEQEGDWMDDTSNNSDLEMLQTMANRQKKHLQDLENALIRVENKSYGICVVTGQLIDKKRLLAVPTTTKSVAAKNALAAGTGKEERRPAARTSLQHKPRIETKVIKRKTESPTPAPQPEIEEEEELFDVDLIDENEGIEEPIDLDSIVDSSTEDY